jgi:hypothetical protein
MVAEPRSAVKNSILVVLITLSIGSGAVAGSASADPVSLIEFTGGNASATAADTATYGWAFSTSIRLSVSALGLWDEQRNAFSVLTW